MSNRSLACKGVAGARAWVDNMWVDGICGETGWIDPALWEKLSPSDRTRYYELVQTMLAEKRSSARGQPSGGDGAQQDGFDQHDDGATYDDGALPSVQQDDVALDTHDVGQQDDGRHAVAQGDSDQQDGGQPYADPQQGDPHSDTQHDSGQLAEAKNYSSAPRGHFRLFQAQAVVSDLYKDLFMLQKKVDAQAEMIDALAKNTNHIDNQI